MNIMYYVFEFNDLLWRSTFFKASEEGWGRMHEPKF